MQKNILGQGLNVSMDLEQRGHRSKKTSACYFIQVTKKAAFLRESAARKVAE